MNQVQGTDADTSNPITRLSKEPLVLKPNLHVQYRHRDGLKQKLYFVLVRLEESIMNVGWWNTTMPDATSTAVDFFEQ